MAKKLKVGMIGSGNIAHTHVPGWNNSRDTDLIVGCDIDVQKFAPWQQKYGLTNFYEDEMELIRDPRIVIVDICTPDMYHAPMTIAALAVSKHIICEKPLAPTPGEIRQILQARDSSGKKLMPALHFRLHRTCKTPY